MTDSPRESRPTSGSGEREALWTFLRRALCLLGFHEWEIDYGKTICERCGRELT